MLHFIQHLYRVLAELIKAGVKDINDFIIACHLAPHNNLATFTYLFASNCCIKSVRDWWFFHESMIIVSNNIGELADKYINPEGHQQEASTSAPSELVSC
jgi:hypothetical protein